MGDYINIKDDRLWDILFDEACVEGKQAERIQKELEKIAVNKKEIIRRPIERILKRLERAEQLDSVAHVEGSNEEILTNGYVKGIKKSIKVIKREAGGDND